MIRRYQIFVSSTYEDLHEERQAVMWQLLKSQYIPCGMESFKASNDRGWRIIKEAIDNSDYFVVIIAGAYGTIDSKSGLSWTEMEYNYAKEKKIPILAFIRGKAHIAEDNIEKDSIKNKKMQNFISKLKRHHANFWATTEDLCNKVAESIRSEIEWYARENKTRHGWFRGSDILTEQNVKLMSSYFGKTQAPENLWINNLAYLSEIIKDIKDITEPARAGVVCVLHEKRKIDYEKLVPKIKKRLWFFGLSERSFTSTGRMEDIFHHLLQRQHNVSVRYLLLDPESAAAKMRNKDEVYHSRRSVIAAIKESISSLHSFRKGLSPKQKLRFDVRTYDGCPPASFFLADDFAYFSLFTSNRTGGTGQCFICHNYSKIYQDLEAHYSATWKKALSIYNKDYNKCHLQALERNK